MLTFQLSTVATLQSDSSWSLLICGHGVCLGLPFISQQQSTITLHLTQLWKITVSIDKLPLFRANLNIAILDKQKIQLVGQDSLQLHPISTAQMRDFVTRHGVGVSYDLLAQNRWFRRKLKAVQAPKLLRLPSGNEPRGWLENPLSILFQHAMFDYRRVNMPTESVSPR